MVFLVKTTNINPHKIYEMKWNTIPQLAEGIVADLWRDF